MISDVERKQLAEIFRKYPEIQAVFAFGSQISGRTHKESDLDLAVLPCDPGARTRKMELLADLVRHGFDDCDLVFLDTEDIVLRYEAVKYNHLVYQSEDFDRGSTYSLVVRQYLDFLPYLKVQRETLKRRILSGQQGNHPEADQ
jgi:predicted nucleotidyltransferase